MSKVTIYHNPRCSKSRQTMALLEEKNITPEIVLYLETPPDKEQLNKLLAMLGIGARDLVRKSEDEYASMGLANKELSDAELVEAMVKAPRLIQRPIVVVDGKARIGRPPESVLEIL